MTAQNVTPDDSSRARGVSLSPPPRVLGDIYAKTDAVFDERFSVDRLFRERMGSIWQGARG